MPRILMCPPQYYGIEYEINPWMSRSRGADREAAEGQWRQFYRILKDRLGVEVELLPPQVGLPDLVFTANAGLPYGCKFIASNFRYPERQREVEYFIAWFRDQGYEVIHLPETVHFEGAGDALFAGKALFAGYRFRSDADVHPMLSELLGIEVTSLELVDPRFYHLDTCFCPLGAEEAIWYPPAFDDFSRWAVRAWLPNLIEVTDDEALRFACNAVAIGRDIVINSGCPRLTEELEQRGYRVFSTDLSEFIKAGGSAKCLTLLLEGVRTNGRTYEKKNERRGIVPAVG